MQVPHVEIFNRIERCVSLSPFVYTCINFFRDIATFLCDMTGMFPRNDTHSISKKLSNSFDSCTQISPDNLSRSIDSFICHLLTTLFFSISLLSYGCTPGNKTEFLASQNLTEEEFQEHPTINWDAILWVRRPLELWVVQVILAMVSLTEALLLAYLGYKVRFTTLFTSKLFSCYCVIFIGGLSILYTGTLFYKLDRRKVPWNLHN